MNKVRHKSRAMCLLSLLAGAILAASCGAPASGPGSNGDGGQQLQVVATTSIVADVVRQVGGDRIALTTLMGPGIDPHSYVPAPADVAALHDADLIVANGAGLEADLENVLQSAGGQATLVELSDGLDLRPAAGGEPAKEGGDDHGDFDPHVWFSVPNVIRWVDRIAASLSQADPEGADQYQANAAAYSAELEELDAWVRAQVDTIPPAHRKLVTNHATFGYFADTYGLEQVGTIYPISPAAEPSAQDIAALQDAIRHYGVPAVFTESTVNPRLAEQVAADTGIRLVPLYTDSLAGPGSGAESYLEMMRYDVAAIVEALR